MAVRRKDGLEAVREAAKKLRAAERTVDTRRRQRDRAIFDAVRQIDPDADRPRPRHTQEEVGKAAGIQEPRVRKILSARR